MCFYRNGLRIVRLDVEETCFVFVCRSAVYMFNCVSICILWHESEKNRIAAAVAGYDKRALDPLHCDPDLRTLLSR